MILRAQPSHWDFCVKVEFIITKGAIPGFSKMYIFVSISEFGQVFDKSQFNIPNCQMSLPFQNDELEIVKAVFPRILPL